MAEVKKMDNLLDKIQSQNISYTNKLIYAAAMVVTERLGVKLDRQKSWKEPKFPLLLLIIIIIIIIIINTIIIYLSRCSVRRISLSSDVLNVLQLKLMTNS